MNPQISRSVKNLKTILAIIFTIVLFVGVLLDWQYWRGQKEIKVPEDKVIEKRLSKDEIADWKTYGSKEYRFEIKYPPYYVVEEYEPKSKRDYKILVNFFDKKWKEIKIHHPGCCIRVIETELLPKEWLHSDENFTSEYKESEQSNSDPPCGFTNVKQGTINEIPVLQYKVLAASGSTDYTLFQGKENILYSIGTHSCGSGIFPEDIYNQMLSTFRFFGVNDEKSAQLSLNSG